LRCGHHRPPNVDDAGRTDLVRASRRSDTTAFGKGIADTVPDTMWDDWPADGLARRHGLRLPSADGLRQLGPTVFLNLSATARPPLPP
jgi:hypothetical protein